MCGICGVVRLGGGEPAIPRARFLALRDALAHRGPDDAGLFEAPGVLLGHRRLIVIDRSPAGAQPMSTPDGRFTIIYNGELYNDADLRNQLEREGVRFRSSCDTETVLHAVARWGAAAGERLRGMYALALWDSAERTLLLGRDQFGIKPLYWAVAGGGGGSTGPAARDAGELVFASEPAALFEHPGLSPEPDPAVVSAYVSTNRVNVGERTMFDGVRIVEPGAWLRFTIGRGPEPQRARHAFIAGAAGPVRDAVAGSVTAHLRSDVPWCSLLSGGLDSSIVALIASREAGPLRTYVSGCPSAGEGLADDFAFARLAADALGTLHTEIPVERTDFSRAWPDLVQRTGLPLTTPNTVAIHAVARGLREGGHVVTLSGEGADELFGGYDLSLRQVWNHVSQTASATDPSDERDAEFSLAATAWIQPAQKHEFLQPGFLDEAGGDRVLLAAHERAFAASLDEARVHHPGTDRAALRLEAHLGVQRRLNLSALLLRLDAATMQASVEGRTPFADAAVADVAAALPMSAKYVPGVNGAPDRTKIALRDAFAGELPRDIVARPKRSFPLPFGAWIGDATDAVRGSPLVGRVYRPAAVALATAEPQRVWNLAWPMVNLALWSRRWWS